MEKGYVFSKDAEWKMKKTTSNTRYSSNNINANIVS